LTSSSTCGHSVLRLPWPAPQRGRAARARHRALRDTLLRVSRLADGLPHIAELDLNPVIVGPDRVIAVDARIRVTSEHLADAVPAPPPPVTASRRAQVRTQPT